MEPKHRWNVERLKDDMGARGLTAQDIGRLAEIHAKSVHRFLRGEFQTPRMAARIAGALGFPVRRYLVEDDWRQPSRKGKRARKPPAPPKVPDPTVDVASQSNAPD